MSYDIDEMTRQLDNAIKYADEPTGHYNKKRKQDRSSRPKSEETMRISFETHTPNGRPVQITCLVREEGVWYAKTNVSTNHVKLPVRWVPVNKVTSAE